MGARVHPRVSERHPELRDEDVLSAWGNAYWYKLRIGGEKTFHIAIGADSKSRFIEMVAVEDDGGVLVIFHAITPPSTKTLKKLGIRGR